MNSFNKMKSLDLPTLLKPNPGREQVLENVETHSVELQPDWEMKGEHREKGTYNFDVTMMAKCSPLGLLVAPE